MSIRQLRLPLIFAVLLLVGGVSARAAQQASAPAAPANRSTAAVREERLPNGLLVLLKEDHSAPVVSFSVWYRVGSRNEHTGITGVSHLLEHLLFKDLKNYPQGRLDQVFYVNGATTNAFTFYDWTYYWEMLAADRLETALQVEADRMVNARINQADLDSEMTVVRSELEGGENDPMQVLSKAVEGTAFQAHPYRWPIIGYPTDVENVSRQSIYDYYRRHYGPNNAILVMVGDFETEKALQLVRKHYGGIKPIPAPPEVYTHEPPQRGERRITVRQAGSLPIVMLAYKTPEAKSPDFYAIDALSYVLARGRASRLYQNLVEKQIAADASAAAQSLKDPWLFQVYGTAQPGVSAEKLESALQAEVERLTKEPVSQQELDRIKSGIVAEFVLRRDSIDNQMQDLAYWEIAVGDWRYLDTYVERIQALTPADLQRVAQKYFVPERRTVGHFIPTTGEESAPADADVPAAETAPDVPAATEPVGKPARASRQRPVPIPKSASAPPVDRKITRFTLDNGVRIVVQEKTSNPTFALQGSLPAGEVFEPAGKYGIADVTATMLRRGTQQRTTLQLNEELERMGATLEFDSGPLVTSVAGQGLSKDFPRVMDLLAEMLRQPAFRENDLEVVKAQALAGLEQQKDSPQDLAHRQFSRAVYPEGHPLRPVTLEEEQKALQGITRADVEAFYRGQYGPQGMILTLVGDVKAEQVRQALQARLGDWPKNPQAKPIPTLDLTLQPIPVRSVVQVPDKTEAVAMWGHAGGLRRGDPDFYATSVLEEILGGDLFHSRLGTRIRKKEGLVYGVYGSFGADLYPGEYVVNLGANPENVNRAVRSLEEEVRRIREQGVTQREVEEAVSYLIGSFTVRFGTSAGMARALWAMEFYNLGPDYLDRRTEYYGAVTAAAVNEAAKKHLHPDRATVVIAGTVPEK